MRSATTLLLLVLAVEPALSASPWPQSAGARARALVVQMSLDEKLTFLQGDGAGPYAGHLPGLPRLGIPPLTLEDAPSGVADGLRAVTAFPTTLSFAQSFDVDLVHDVGAAMGVEFFGKGVNVALGPGVNLARVPWGGRLYEYLGEDPHLASAMTAAMIRGIQRSNVSTTIKHFICNNQESNRNGMSADVPERALRELYLPAYAAAVDAGAGAFMVAVNQLNGTENSANNHSLGALFAELGFDGFCMTDWAGIMVPNAGAAALAGTSVEMPRGYQYQYLPAYIANGTVPLAVIDGLVTRVLTPAAALGLLDTPPDPDRNPSSPVTNAAHAALARAMAEASAVLLKNAPPAGSSTVPLLPLNATELAASGRGIAVFGDQNTVVGCGSGQQVTPYVITPAGGLYAYFNPNASRPTNCTLFPDVDFFQDGVPCVTRADASACCAACTATAGCNFWTFLGDANCPNDPMPQPAGQCFLKPDDAGRTPHAGLVSGQCAPYAPGPVPITYDPGVNLTRVMQLSRQSDVVLVVVTATGCEGSDRVNLSLSPGHDALVSAAVAANPRTVVVTRCGGPCLMPWAADVPAILQTGLAGQEAGSALARLLMGDVSPSGKLALSFPLSEYDSWIESSAQYPGIIGPDGWQHAVYSEGLQVGYKWYDARALQPQWPFGHGLSYGDFMYSAPALNVSTLAPGAPVSASFLLGNAGRADAREVVQLYVEYPPLADEPPRLLKGFAKVFVPAGSPPVAVAFTLHYEDLTVWGSPFYLQGYAVVPGNYTLRIGGSSRDLPLALPLVVVAAGAQ